MYFLRIYISCRLDSYDGCSDANDGIDWCVCFRTESWWAAHVPVVWGQVQSVLRDKSCAAAHGRQGTL